MRRMDSLESEFNNLMHLFDTLEQTSKFPDSEQTPNSNMSFKARHKYKQSYQELQNLELINSDRRKINSPSAFNVTLSENAKLFIATPK